MRASAVLFLLGSFVLAACASGAGADDAEPGFEETAGGSAGEAGSGGSEAGGSNSEGGSGGSDAGSGGSDAGAGGSDAGSGGSSSGSGGSGGSGGSTAGSGGSGGSSAGAGGSAAGAGGSAAGAGGSAAGSGGSAGGSSGSGGSGAGAGGSAGTAGSAGSGGGLSCEDQGVEPNNSTALAAPACVPGPCEISGSDGDGSVGYKGTKPALFGTVSPEDKDYFKFKGSDTFGSVTDPSAKTDSSGIKLCIFTACPNGTQDHECTSTGSLYEENEAGLPGCCIEGPGEVKSDHDCAGSVTDDDSAEIYIRVTATKNACTDYSVDFHF